MEAGAAAVSTVGKKADPRKEAEEARPPRGAAPRPDKRPASDEALRDFLRRGALHGAPGAAAQGVGISCGRAGRSGRPAAPAGTGDGQDRGQAREDPADPGA